MIDMSASRNALYGRRRMAGCRPLVATGGADFNDMAAAIVVENIASLRSIFEVELTERERDLVERAIYLDATARHTTPRHDTSPHKTSQQLFWHNSEAIM